MAILILILLVLTIIMVGISVDRRLSDQADLIVQLQRENFINSNDSYNKMASYVGKTNYLLSSALNEKYNKDMTPAYIPDRNSPRGSHAYNFLAKNKINLPDANDVTGFRNPVSFPGPINPTKLPKSHAREVKKPEEVQQKLEETANIQNVATDNLIQIEGAAIKPEKVVSVEGEPIVTPTTTIEGETAEEAPNFSTNNRMNASAARNLAPNESSAQAALENFNWKKVGNAFTRPFKAGKRQ